MMHNIKSYIIRNVINNLYHIQEDVKQIRHNLDREITTSRHDTKTNRKK